MRVQRPEDMPVYQLAYQMAIAVEGTTRSFGPDFRWLRQQALRSSESVCANLAEGFYSQYSTEYLHSLHRCSREARETMMHLRYAGDVGQLNPDRATEMVSSYEEVARQLHNLLNSIERKIEIHGKTRPPPHLLLAIARTHAA